MTSPLARRFPRLDDTLECRSDELDGTVAGEADGMVVAEVDVGDRGGSTTVRFLLNGDSSVLNLNGDDVVVEATLSRNLGLTVELTEPESGQGQGAGYRIEDRVLRVGVPTALLSDPEGYAWRVQVVHDSTTVECSGDGLLGRSREPSPFRS